MKTKRRGRRALTPEEIEGMAKDRSNRVRVEEIAKKYNVSPTTVYDMTSPNKREETVRDPYYFDVDQYLKELVNI